MNNGSLGGSQQIFFSRTFGRGYHKLLSFVTCLASILMAGTPYAGSLVTDPDFVDNGFEAYYLRPCLDGPVSLLTQGWSNLEIIDYNNAICNVVFNSGTFTSTDTYVSASTLGSNGAQSKASSAVASQQVTSVKDRLDELGIEEAKGGWGLLLAVQQGETDRFATNNETGYDSDLKGFVVGGDYRFNDALVAGVALGYTKDEAVFDNNTGTLDTTGNSLTVYFTVVPLEGAYIDGYLGISQLEFSNSREISVDGEPADAFGLRGRASGDFDGEQDMIGASAGYDWYLGAFSVGPYIAVDYNKTEVDGYTERGNTNLELIYPDQTSSSKLYSLGINVSHITNFDWGSLLPSFSTAMLHESNDDARAFNTRLLVSPAVDTSAFRLQTDAPDKDYNLSSVGLTAAMNSGTQIFITYEQIFAHEFRDTWAVSAGVLTEF